MTSIVVAVRDMSAEQKVLDNLAGCGDEVIIIEGKNPSLQRNEGIRRAKGDIIYFADNDSVVDPAAFKTALEILKAEPGIAVLGGPSITPKTDSFLQKAFGAVFASPWASGKSSSRYRRAGTRRDADEKELILCNLFVRRRVFEKAGFFREDLYPNEENEFLNRAQQEGFRAVYDPAIYVTRSQRKSPAAFIKQCFTYGRGRAEQMLVSFDKKDIINTVPAFFVVYLAYLALTGPFAEEFMPLAVYLAGTAFFSVVESKNAGGPAAFPAVFLSFTALHLMYGTGFIFGMIKGIVVRRGKRSPEISVKVIERRAGK